jgi:DNA-binding NarL/FixJ family response regulator
LKAASAYAGSAQCGNQWATTAVSTAAGMTRRLVDTFVQPSPPPGTDGCPARCANSPREQDILRAIARGVSNAEICAELYLTEPTVKAHVTHVLAKLGVRDRVHAVVLAYETGFVQTVGGGIDGRLSGRVAAATRGRARRRSGRPSIRS